MRLGLLGGGDDWQESIEQVRIAEDLGFELVASGEAWGKGTVPWLAAVALNTSEITIGTSILNVFSRTPAALAQEFATLEEMSGAASNLRAHSESEVGAPVVTGGPHAAAISESSERQRAAKSRRCSARGIESPRPRRQRKYCRNSSNAEQKRAADAKLPKPRIG